MSSPFASSTYDAIVVGARCAGAATAMLLARGGMRVLLLDQGAPGSDVTSTHALMRGGVLQLARWGLLAAIEQAGTPPIRHTTFHYGESSVPVPIQPRGLVGALYAPRRILLDSLLVEAAQAAGVEVAHWTRVERLLRDGQARVQGVQAWSFQHQRAFLLSARTVIGADGLYSRVATQAQAGVYRRGTGAAGVLYSYWEGLEDSGYHWYYRPGISAGIIPTNGDQACVFVAVAAERFAHEVGGDAPSAYLRLLHQAVPDGRWAWAQQRTAPKGFGGHRGYFRAPWGPGWALVGDAGYFRDPLTAHGITDALRDAELLARALLDGSPRALAQYAQLRDQLAAPLFEASDAIARMDWTLPQVQALHRAMTRAMGEETQFLAQLGPWPSADGGAREVAAQMVS